MGEINEKKKQNIMKASWWVDGNNNECYHQTLCGRDLKIYYFVMCNKI
jgi:hypothetical protein